MEIGTTVVFLNICNGLSSILDLKHFNMNLNDNLHICASFFNGFLIAVFCNDMMNMVAKIICLGEWRLGIGTTQLFTP